MPTAGREFWTQDGDGRWLIAAITYTTEEAIVVWPALCRARPYVEERTYDPDRYKGRFIRCYEENVGIKSRKQLEAEGVDVS